MLLRVKESEEGAQRQPPQGAPVRPQFNAAREEGSDEENRDKDVQADVLIAAKRAEGNETAVRARR